MFRKSFNIFGTVFQIQPQLWSIFVDTWSFWMANSDNMPSSFCKPVSRHIQIKCIESSPQLPRSWTEDEVQGPQTTPYERSPMLLSEGGAGAGAGAGDLFYTAWPLRYAGVGRECVEITLPWWSNDIKSPGLGNSGRSSGDGMQEGTGASRRWAGFCFSSVSPSLSVTNSYKHYNVYSFTYIHKYVVFHATRTLACKLWWIVEFTLCVSDARIVRTGTGTRQIQVVKLGRQLTSRWRIWNHNKPRWSFHFYTYV